MPCCQPETEIELLELHVDLQDLAYMKPGFPSVPCGKKGSCSVMRDHPSTSPFDHHCDAARLVQHRYEYEHEPSGMGKWVFIAL